VVLIFLSFSIPARAGLLETINDSYIDSVYDLPAQGSPAIAWQQQGYIRAWVDIVGFRDLAFINGAFYVPGDPANYAIVQSDAIGTPPGVLDSLTKTISFSQSENNLTACLNVLLKWHVICCDKSGCFVCGRFSEAKDFTDTEISPRPFYPDAESAQVNDVEYNHSIIVQRLLYLNTSPLITKYNISVPNGSVTHRLQIAQIDYTEKGIPYANYSVFDTWKTQGKGINQQYEASVIDDLNASYSIQAFTPFGLLTTVPTIIKSNNTWSPEKTFSSFTFLIIFIFGVLVAGLFLMRS
jgi:hypothetical protein